MLFIFTTGNIDGSEAVFSTKSGAQMSFWFNLWVGRGGWIELVCRAGMIAIRKEACDRHHVSRRTPVTKMVNRSETKGIFHGQDWHFCHRQIGILNLESGDVRCRVRIFFLTDRRPTRGAFLLLQLKDEKTWRRI